MASVSKIALEKLRDGLPPVAARSELTKLTGGVVNSGTIANLMSRGDGPPCFYLGRKACVERDSFLEWLAPRLSDSNTEALGLQNEE